MPGEVVHPLLVALALSLFGTTIHRRLPPRIAARFIAALLVIVMIAAVPTIALLTLATLAHLPPGHPLQWCTVPRHHHDVQAWMGPLAVGLAALAVWRVRRVLAEHRRLICDEGGHQVHVTADAEPYAVTMPGAAGLVVLSSGLVSVLDPVETRVVVAHEQAHARHRHDRYLLLGELVAAVLPPARWLTSRLRFSVERWADDEAAAACGDRRLVAHTIGKVALIAAPPAPIVLAASFVGLGEVERVRMLLEPEVRRVQVPYRAMLTTSGLLVAAFTIYQLHHLAPLLSFLCDHH